MKIRRGVPNLRKRERGKIQDETKGNRKSDGYQKSNDGGTGDFAQLAPKQMLIGRRYGKDRKPRGHKSFG